MNDNAISYDSAGNMSVDTYAMSDYTAGTNDFGQDLYVLDGIEMTNDQAEENAHFFADDDDGYGTNSYDQETLPDTMLEGLHRINGALGGEGAAEFMADQLLGIGDDRMDQVIGGTQMSKDEIQSHGAAVLIDMAHNMRMDHNMLIDALNEDIAYIRSARSDLATREMHQVITDAIAGNYEASMTRWDRLRGVMRSIR